MFLFLLFLFVLGLVLGSFSSVIIYRLKSGEKGIFMGRSKCPNCETTLGVKDLVPVFSYLSTAGKCRYCSQKISVYYPSLELSLGLFFVAIGYFLVDFQLILSGSIQELAMLEFWLFVGFFSFIYTVYDILYLEIPESVLIILVVGVFLSLIINTFLPTWYQLPTYSQNFTISIDHILAIFITAISLVGLYVIMLCGLDEKYDILIFLGIIGLLLGLKYGIGTKLTDITLLSALIGALAIFAFFFFQILVSKGKWMGAGDLRIAIVIGLILGSSYWHAGLMITYLSGSIIGLGFIIYSRFIKKEKTFNTQIPFGPFLTIGLFTTLFFQDEIQTFIKNYFLL